MTREPDLEIVNRALSVQVQKLMDEMRAAQKELMAAHNRIRELEARLAHQERAAHVEIGR